MEVYCYWPVFNQSMTNLDTPSSIIDVMAGPSSTSSEMSDDSAIFQSVALIQETLRVMMQHQDVLAANQQEILQQLNQMGGARQDLGTTIELDVARTLEELAVLEAKLKEHLDYKKTMMGAIMRSLSGLKDMAVEDLTTSAVGPRSVGPRSGDLKSVIVTEWLIL
ncbi:hypothetical protein UPYG_G00284350 [Umbra pygmaea]|uniref:Uncharacterized protein n=1 Tax=Umbra pygmaea TaxID=75934 RepID=A0ABD0W4P4_UMBPY